MKGVSRIAAAVLPIATLVGVLSLSTSASAATTLLHTYSVNPTPEFISLCGTTAWITSTATTMITQVNEETGFVKTITLAGTGPGALAATKTGIWVTESGKVREYSPTMGAVMATLTFTQPQAITASGGYIWVASDVTGRIAKITETTRSVVRTIV